MDNKRKMLIAGGTAVLLAAAGAGVAAAASASDDDDTDVPITGEELDAASAAALDVTGGGTVTDSEKGDEEGFYEVEVTLEDGSQVDVHLDADLNHLGSERDGADDENGRDDD